MCKYCNYIGGKYFINVKDGALRVWHNPQIGSRAGTFYYPAESIREAKHMLEMLAQYDLFQYEHQIKPDYANASGLQVFESGMWIDWENEDGYDIDDVDEDGEHRE